MGSEARCTARLGRKRADGRALLETDELIFRSDELKLKIPLAGIQKAQARDGLLEVAWADGVVTFQLGALADKWLRKIQQPKSPVDKLAVKPGATVALVGGPVAALAGPLRERGCKVTVGMPRAAVDALFVAVAAAADLARIEAWKARLAEGGALWIVREKGAPPSESEVMAAGRAAGMNDVKVVRLSDAHTAEKFMVRRAS